MVVSSQAELSRLSEAVLVDQGGHTICIIALNQVPQKEVILFLPYLEVRSKIITKQLKTCINKWLHCSLDYFPNHSSHQVFFFLQRQGEALTEKNLSWLDSPELALQLDTIFVSYGVIWPQMTSISPPS